MVILITCTVPTGSNWVNRYFYWFSSNFSFSLAAFRYPLWDTILYHLSRNSQNVTSW